MKMEADSMKKFRYAGMGLLFVAVFAFVGCNLGSGGSSGNNKVSDDTEISLPDLGDFSYFFYTSTDPNSTITGYSRSSTKLSDVTDTKVGKDESGANKSVKYSDIKGKYIYAAQFSGSVPISPFLSLYRDDWPDDKIAILVPADLTTSQLSALGLDNASTWTAPYNPGNGGNEGGGELDIASYALKCGTALASPLTKTNLASMLEVDSTIVPSGLKSSDIKVTDYGPANCWAGNDAIAYRDFTITFTITPEPDYTFKGTETEGNHLLSKLKANSGAVIKAWLAKNSNDTDLNSPVATIGTFANNTWTFTIKFETDGSLTS
jgi:hypothetical protein